MKITDLLRGWLAAAAIYVLAELATAIALKFALDATSLPQVAERASTAPWLVPAVLSVIAALVAVRRKVTADWWKWLLLTMAIPTIGGAITVSMLTKHGVDAGQVASSAVTHVAVAGVLGVTAGAVLNAVRKTVRR